MEDLEVVATGKHQTANFGGGSLQIRHNGICLVSSLVTDFATGFTGISMGVRILGANTPTAGIAARTTVHAQG